MTYNMTHTINSIAETANTTARTVRRWVAKHPDIGQLIGNVRHFSDAERDLLLSHQAKPKQAAQVVEAEIVTGNHRAAADLSIDVEQPVDLARWRGNQLVQLATIGGDNLSQLEQLVSRVSAAIDADWSGQMADYDESQEQITRAKAVKAQLERKALTYEIKSELLGKLRSQNSGELQTLTEELAALLRS